MSYITCVPQWKASDSHSESMEWIAKGQVQDITVTTPLPFVKVSPSIRCSAFPQFLNDTFLYVHELYHMHSVAPLKHPHGRMCFQEQSMANAAPSFETFHN